MAKYFFHVHDCLGVIKDDEGMELTNFAEVQAEAIRSAQDMIAQGRKLGAPGLDRKIVVVAENGEVALTLRFADVFPREADQR